MDVEIVRLNELPADGLAGLVAEAERHGFRFVRRLAEEWASGATRFDGPGEALFAAVVGGRVIGVCGLTADPYAAASRVGRVRRLYVAAAHRRDVGPRPCRRRRGALDPSSHGADAARRGGDHNRFGRRRQPTARARARGRG